MLVVRHQDQEIAGGREPLDRHVLGVGGNVDGDQKSARVQLAPQRLDEQRQLPESLRSQLLQIDVHACVAALLADPRQLPGRALARIVGRQHHLGQARGEPSFAVVGDGGHHLEPLRRLKDPRVLLDDELASRLDADPLRHRVRELIRVLLQRAQARRVPVHHEGRQHRRRRGGRPPPPLGRLRLLQERPEPPFLPAIGGLSRALVDRVGRGRPGRGRRFGQDLSSASPGSGEDRDEERAQRSERGGASGYRGEAHRGAPSSRFVPEYDHVSAV